MHRVNDGRDLYTPVAFDDSRCTAVCTLAAFVFANLNERKVSYKLA